MTGVARRFAEAFGAEPAGVWSAPGRVNLIGEHTDYNDGLALPFAIDRRTVVAVAPRSDGALRLVSAQRPQDRVLVEAAELRHATGWPAYVAGVLAVARELADGVPGLDVWLDSSVPVGSGLSSSAAMECAVAQAINDLAGLRRSPAELARLAQRAENEVAGVPCGLLDQMAAMAATAGHLLFYDFATGDTRQVPFDPDSAGYRVLVVDTKVHHAHAEGGYAERRRSCEEAARRLAVRSLREIPADELPRLGDRLGGRPGDEELLARTRHVVTENHRVVRVCELLTAGDWAGIGPMLTASHRSLQRDYQVSAVELDAVVDTALATGALGARMTGGGFGGSAIALLPADAVATVSSAVNEDFVHRGWATPEIRLVRPSAGARCDLRR